MRISMNFAAVTLALALCTACSNDSDVGEPEEETGASAEPAVAANPNSFPDVVATVNGTAIAKSELLDRVATIEAQSPSDETSSVAFFRRVLDEIVGAELLYQASMERNLAVDDDAIEQQLDVLRARFPEPGTFTRALEQQGLTLDGLKEQMAFDMSIQRLIETDITPAVSVTDEAKRTYYDENPQQMRLPDQLRLSHILKRVAPDASPETKAAAREDLADILEQARDGADFAVLAREHSDDPGSAANGGELLVGRGDTVPPFEQAAFALEPGGLSPVVETQFGFHIIKLSEKIEGQLVPYEQVEPRIEEFLRQQAVQAEIESTVDSLKARAKIELFI